MDDQAGIEWFVDLLMGPTERSEQTVEELVQALQPCGIRYGPVPSSGVEGTFAQASALWLQFNLELHGLIDRLQKAAPFEELDALFYGASATAPKGVPECLERYAGLLPSGG